VSNYERWAELSDRDAIGDELTGEERAFLEEHASEDPLAAAETELWASMRTLPPLDDAAGDRAVAERAVHAVVGERRGRVFRWAPYVAAAMAAAAGVALYVAGGEGPATVAVSTTSAVLEFVSSGARVSGVAAEKGATVAVGREIEAVGGAVCVAVERTVHACLPSGSKVRLSQFGGKERRIDLLSGRVAVALAPLPQGERLFVAAGESTSTAVGTAFTVELRDLAARTVVHEGKVAVAHEGETALVTAHKIGLSGPEGVQVEVLADHSATMTEDWVALASVAGRSVEGEMAETAALVVAPSVEAPVPPPLAARLPAHVATRVDGTAAKAAPLPEATPAPVPGAAASTPGTLLASARQALREQRWKDAAAAYESIITGFPSSPEARTVVVPLAKLELDRLGNPASALSHLEPYLRSGGSLAVEAEMTRIRALRSLGRTGEEERAIDGFLSAHPSSLEAPELRKRKAALTNPQ
jgi:ferric-dicitrate binding protein FerR (iron transport regulator)